jgi:hypothetical protein
LSHIIFVLVWAQATTFVGLGAAKLCVGDVRLGLAQMCLAVVTALVYL